MDIRIVYVNGGRRDASFYKALKMWIIRNLKIRICALVRLHMLCIVITETLFKFVS